MQIATSGREVAASEGSPLTLRAADGARLAARRYSPPQAPTGRIVVAAATGVSQGFYRRFAQFSAARGFEVLTFDYRGLGGSRPTSLRGYQADMLDWVKDLDAAVEAIPEDGVPLFAVTHSYGGHAVGLMARSDRLRGAWMAGLGTGWHGWMAPRDRLGALLFWKLAGPLVTAVAGRLPMAWFGMGHEELPVGVYRHWRRWCGFRRFYLDDPAYPDFGDRCARLRAPICGVTALDDAWATPISRDTFLPAFKQAPLHRLDVDPAPYGGLGHMGYFQAGAEPLWAHAVDFFDTQRQADLAPAAHA